jgi:predicted flap endonuclease-1-like 5' DNA nuclease
VRPLRLYIEGTVVFPWVNTMAKIEDIEGIGPTYATKLKAAGVNTTDDLLKAGSLPKGRKDLAEKTGISATLILEWVNLADLFRIKGVGEEYSDLLEEAGVDTVVELSRRNPENLHAKVCEVNDEKKLARRPPTLNEIRSWIDQAKALPRIVEY